MDDDQFASISAASAESLPHDAAASGSPQALLTGSPLSFSRDVPETGAAFPETEAAHRPGDSSRSPMTGEFRLLCVGPQEPDWIGLALQLDSAGCADPKMSWVSEAAETMTQLRNESFQAIVITCDDPVIRSGEDSIEPDWHPESLVDAIRASGCSDPIVLISTQPDDSLANLACRHQCELLVSRFGWSSRALVNVIQRSIRQVELQRENHHLAVANHRRLVRERDEADHLLNQQHGIVRELEALANGLSVGGTDATPQPSPEGSAASRPAPPAAGREPDDPGNTSGPLPIPDQIKTYYQELLRTYVIMGSGSLGGEILQLAAVLAEVGLSPRDTLSLHLERVEQLVRGLGNRSTRHVLARADLLALELIIHLGECYQRASRPAD